MNWIQTHTGRAFTPLDPDPRAIDLDDIVWALSHVCRFTGHSRRFYSVAEHSCRVHDEVVREIPGCRRYIRLAALLHDASEAYLCDVARPVKHAPAMAPYREIEARLQAEIARRFGFTPEAGLPVIHRADNVLLSTEKRYLMGPEPRDWGALPEPLTLRWWDRMGWSPIRARWELRRRLRALGVV